MARRTSRTLTEVELEFMQILWAHSEVTPEDIQNILLSRKRTLTGGSIRKMLAILMKKGYVKRSRKGKGFVYRAKVHQEQANRSMIQYLLNRAFGGSASLMVAALLENHPVPGEDLKKIERLIAEHKRKEQK